MRRFLLGTLGVAIVSNFATAQFASPPAAPSASIIPAAPAGPGAVHPWYVKANQGQWMICVKSYSGDDARKLAELLAQDIRERYGVPAYLFERGSEERKKEKERHAAEIARRRAAEARDEQAWAEINAKARAEAAAKGMDFIETKREVKAATVHIEEQWAVLIGGWPDMAAARKEQEKVRRWQPPADKKLMDTQFIVREKDGQRSGELAHVNPFQQSMVVQNPAAPRIADAESEAETRFVMKMNADEEYSVLKIHKPWTIAVKLYTPPVELRGKEQERSMLSKIFNNKPDAMAAAGDQARDMCKALRAMKPTKEFPHGAFEAYVLHTKYGSMVCVGQFDSADDPKLMAMQEKLGLLKFQVGHGNGAPVKEQPGVRLFDHLYAMQVK